MNVQYICCTFILPYVGIRHFRKIGFRMVSVCPGPTPCGDHIVGFLYCIILFTGVIKLKI